MRGSTVSGSTSRKRFTAGIGTDVFHSVKADTMQQQSRTGRRKQLTVVQIFGVSTEEVSVGMLRWKCPYLS